MPSPVSNHLVSTPRSLPEAIITFSALATALQKGVEEAKRVQHPVAIFNTRLGSSGEVPVFLAFPSENGANVLSMLAEGEDERVPGCAGISCLLVRVNENGVVSVIQRDQEGIKNTQKLMDELQIYVL